MTEDSKISGDREQVGAGIQQMIGLMEAEIERLKVSLELARADGAPNRGDLIRQHVSRIDDRQEALDKLRSLQRGADASG